MFFSDPSSDAMSLQPEISSTSTEIALYHHLLTYGHMLLEGYENPVAHLCQEIEQATEQRAYIILWDTDRQKEHLLRYQQYPIFLHNCSYGMIAIDPHPVYLPALSGKFATSLAHFCSIFFYTLEISALSRNLFSHEMLLYREDLTTNQLTVLTYMASGLTDQEIASHLDIRPATVRKHREAIYAKLGVHSRYQAVLAAFHLGLYHPCSELKSTIILNESLPQEDWTTAEKYSSLAKDSR